MNIRVLVLFALTIVVFPGESVAQSFGKLFSTPEQRAKLDRDRENMLAALSEEERIALLDLPPAGEMVPAPEPRLFHMGGSVRRADGNHTVWVNGVAMRQEQLPNNVSLSFERGVGILRVRTIDNAFSVRPGQTLNADTGDIREDYELTDNALHEIGAAIAARDQAENPVQRESTGSQEEVSIEEGPADAERQALIENIVDGLRLLQEAGETQESVQ